MAGKALIFTLTTLVLLCLGQLAVNGVNHQEYLNEFTEQCESNGGVVRTRRGKGWPMPRCVEPKSIINVGMWVND